MRLSRLIPPLPLIAVLALGTAIYFVSVSTPKAIVAEPAFAPPESDFAERLAAVGIVEPASELITIAPPRAGLISEVHVQAGASVKQGQPLFSLDQRDLLAEQEVRRQAVVESRALLAQLQAAPRPETLPPLKAAVRVAAQALADAELQAKLVNAIADERAVSSEERQRKAIAVKAARASLERAEAELKLAEAGTWQAELAVAEQRVASAEAALAAIAVELERSIVRAPIDGVVLKLNVRPGEYANPGASSEPLISFGDIATLHVRADIDEYEAHRLGSAATAVASPRGQSGLRLPLQRVRVEPYVIPKRQLTGAVTERVDTRVVQVIYRLPKDTQGLYVGQQMDVFIDATEAQP